MILGFILWIIVVAVVGLVVLNLMQEEDNEVS